jgi:hypothetical protein
MTTTTLKSAAVSMIYSWYDLPATKTFAFTFTAGPQAKFSFDKFTPPSRTSNRPFKRRRPLWDVDGGPCEGKKKRRLRLNLITSRLSQPFSIPATNIINRGNSKIAIWAKGRRLDKSLLRKAAIMNRVRSRLDAAKAFARRRSEEEVKRQALGLQQVMIQKPRIYNAPLPPSPLGLSNYDALDLEDDVFDEEIRDGDHAEPVIYSDWNVMRPMGMHEGDEYDYLDELDGIPHELPEERAPPPPDERMVEMMKEKERQKELYFVQFIA